MKKLNIKTMKDKAIFKKVHTMVPGCVMLFLHASKYYVYDEDIPVLLAALPLREFTIDNDDPKHARLSFHVVNITEVVHALAHVGKGAFIIEGEDNPFMTVHITPRKVKFNLDED